MTDHQRKRLVDRLLGVSAGDPAAAPLRPVELTVVVATEIRSWIYQPTLDFQYGEWLRERFERGDAAARHSRADPDVTLLVTMTLLADVTLAGPPAADVFDPVPREDFRKALVAEVEGLVRNVDPDTRNVVLTLARVWRSMDSATVHTKDAAAEWALQRLPLQHQAVLARARDIYVGAEEERWDDLRDRIRPSVEALVAEIEAARSGDPEGPL